MITAGSYRVTTAPVPGDKVVLAKLTIGDLAAHASTLVLTGIAAGGTIPEYHRPIQITTRQGPGCSDGWPGGGSCRA
jgi:hypothetical protein